jgi:hypothetical protein
MSTALIMALLVGASYPDVNQAAHAALADAAICSQNRRECGGVVFMRPDGSYAYTAPVTSGKPFGVDLSGPYASAPGPVVADYHVHICSVHNAPFADFFSASDAIANQGLHTVGYMLSLCSWNIHRYDPSQDDADDEEVDLHSGRVFYLTIGHVSGWLAPQERT